ncbi:SRPBCC domain-containing protein [Paractinoplanes rishiriensis]|uniref:Activator of HSP90 ATPase n=1 Tax=Paractinoplanes rishiriensis TaxID=1050105 RepID=A0A919K1N1_9ACTN|nr:SRPBCC domain-containing protein [Actinoplanes rishiriensis]GIE97577.1 activator of HSP90 ATPase [Actinoplanes rishiriensis]
MNPDLDLLLERVIRAPRSAVWNAWTDPARFAKWWLPAPTLCRVERLEVRPGGALVTRLSDDGVEFHPHVDATFLVVEELERIVFTNAIDSSWRPAVPAPVPMTAEVTLADHPDGGTDYRIVVRHGDPAAREKHAELGFADGWGLVTGQLAEVAAGVAVR